MREFFGFGGYVRAAEGFLSWQHLVFVGSLLTLMIVLAVVLGVRNKTKDLKAKNNVLIWAAVLIDAIEIFKIIMLCIRSNSIDSILYDLPLFLCSIQLIALPLAAFSRGRIKEAALDFVCIFGILGAVFGTIGAGQNYGTYPVLSIDNVASGVTHSISGFASLYILFAKMASMKKKNIIFTISILSGFCIVAYIVNVIIDYNYMFLMAGDGTPYDIIYNWVNGNKVLYPLFVVALFFLYIALYYYLFYLFTKKRQNQEQVIEKEERSLQNVWFYIQKRAEFSARFLLNILENNTLWMYYVMCCKKEVF